jgi:hypothetical protein
MKTVVDYTSKITSWHSTKPKFAAEVAAAAAPYVDEQAFLYGLIHAFDLDYAIGAQLDQLGERIGISRYIKLAISVYFSFDVFGLGYDQAAWIGPYDPVTQQVALADEPYRNLLYAKVGANSWDGTAVSAAAILAHISRPVGTNLAYVDNYDLSLTIALSGAWPDPVTLSILLGGYIPVRPCGMEVHYLLNSANNTALFGFDASNDTIQGFDTASWGVTPTPDVLEQIGYQTTLLQFVRGNAMTSAAGSVVATHT